MPQAYKDALNGPVAKPYFPPHPLSNSSTSTALTLQTFIPAQVNTEDENTPGTEAYYNKEEAKKDFVRLLRKTEMEPTSQWNEVLPNIIKNPAFRAVKDPVERKQLFENYLVTLRQEVQEKEKDRRHRVRNAFIQMCKRHPEIKHYTRYKTARPMLQDETDFKAAKDEDERRDLYEEFRVEALRDFEAAEEKEREAARKVFKGILEELNLDPFARWRPTRELFDRKIREDGRQNELAAMSEVDYLNVFEEYVRGLEKEDINARQAEKDAKYRKERKGREAFIVPPSPNQTNIRHCFKNSSKKVSLAKEPSGKKSSLFSKTMKDSSICSANLDQPLSNSSGTFLTDSKLISDSNAIMYSTF